MSNHLSKPLRELLANNENIVFPAGNFNINGWQKFNGRLRYFFSLSILAFFFLFLMPPIMLAAKIKGDDDYAYPWARWGAKKWLRWSGMQIKVTGANNLDRKQSYVFVSNHRSYLDTAMIFAESAIETMKNAAAKLRAEISFGVFAEGTRALPGELLPLKKARFIWRLTRIFPSFPSQ